MGSDDRETEARAATNGAAASAPVSRAASTPAPLAPGTLDGRALLASYLGQSFGGRRDTYQALGYPPAGRDIGIARYRERYERGGIASRIVEAYPRATWSDGAYIQDDPDPEVQTPFEAAFVELAARLDLWSRLMRADILAGIGHYAILLIGAGDDDLSAPLPKPLPASRIPHLTPYPEDRAAINGLVKVASDPRFGLPDSYRVTHGSGTVSARVHWSRVLHIAEGCLTDDVYGRPRLRPVWNYLEDLDKVVGGGSEASWMRADPGTQVNLDPDYDFDEASLADLETQLEKFRHGHIRHLLTKAVTMQQFATQVAAFGDNADTIMDLISGTTGIPKRILLGSERGELASEQDRDNWSDRVDERRRETGTPLVRSLVDRLIAHGALPEPREGEYEVVWPQQEEASDTDKAELVLSYAQANKAMAESGGGLILSATEIRDIVYDLPPLDDVELDAEDLEQEDAADDGADDAADSDRAARLSALVPRGLSRAATLRLAAADLSTSPPDEPEWRTVHRAGDAHREAFARALADTWRAAGESLPVDRLTRLLENGDTTQVATIVEITIRAAAEEMRTSVLPQRLAAVMVDGGLAAVRAARSRGGWFARGATQQQRAASTFSMTFDATSPRVLAYAARRAADLVVEVTPDTVLAIRELIARGVQEGIAPRALAQQVRETVGLHSGQEQAVANLVKELRAADPGAVVKRFPPRQGVRDVAGYRVKVPAKGATDDWIARQAERYRRMQLNLRARTIARTETLRAANEGQRESWLQGVEQGTLAETQQRVLIATMDKRTRDAHAAADGQVRGLKEPFDMGDGTTEPGEGPNCILPGQLVSGSFIAGLKTGYAGPAFEIITKNGHRLSLTPNHPVLTTRGWKAAETIEKGDKLLSYSGIVDFRSRGSSAFGGESTGNVSLAHSGPSVSGIRGVTGYNDKRPMAIQQVFKALSTQREPSVRECSTLDLHGDAKWTNGQVEIVGSDGKLVSESVSERVHGGSEFEFSRAGVVGSLVTGSGSGELTLQRPLAASRRVPRGGELSLDESGVLLDPAPLQVFGLGPASDWNIIKPETANEDRASNSGFRRELLHRSAGEITLDEVVEIRNFNFLGHVYDLQSVVGWMIAGGIVISNCRCAQGLASDEDVARERERSAA